MEQKQQVCASIAWKTHLVQRDSSSSNMAVFWLPQFCVWVFILYLHGPEAIENRSFWTQYQRSACIVICKGLLTFQLCSMDEHLHREHVLRFGFAGNHRTQAATHRQGLDLMLAEGRGD